MPSRRKNLSPQGIQATQLRRLALFAVCLVAGFCGLGFRLYDLQVLQHEELSDEARNNTERTFVRQPVRGDIRDARGHLLATSKIVKTVSADPSLIGPHSQLVAGAIAPILELPVAEVEEKLRPRLRMDAEGQPVEVKYTVLKRKVEEEVWQRVRAAMTNLNFGIDEARARPKVRAQLGRVRRRAVFDEPEQVRFYPNGSLAAHVVGYVGVQENAAAKGPADGLEGKDGLELVLNNALTGIQGWKQTETDSALHELITFREQDVAAKAGLDAILTLDAGVQHIVEDELAAAMAKHTPISISCVVVRPGTGEVLALANLPTFDPNRLDGEPAARRNRVISDLAEPGSTFKIVVVSAALNEGMVRLTDTFDCENGRFIFAGRSLTDHEKYGVLTVERIVSKSSNIGSAKIGIRLGDNKMFDYIRAFGFGQRTGISLPGEVRGISHSLDRWTKLSISRIAMGHEIAATPLQMAMAMSAIANRGVLMRPLLVDRLIGPRGETVAKFQPQTVRRVISEDVAAKMVHALVEAVSTNGTGLKARLDRYTVAGKTGTSQKIVDGRYVRNKHFSSFIGFFPSENPELCISVVMDEPRQGYYGGETAAPIFARIAERAANYLAIAPDRPIGTNFALAGLPVASSTPLVVKPSQRNTRRNR